MARVSYTIRDSEVTGLPIVTANADDVRRALREAESRRANRRRIRLGVLAAVGVVVVSLVLGWPAPEHAATAALLVGGITWFVTS